jgi:hypothetical protein
MGEKWPRKFTESGDFHVSCGINGSPTKNIRINFWLLIFGLLALVKGAHIVLYQICLAVFSVSFGNYRNLKHHLGKLPE